MTVAAVLPTVLDRLGVAAAVVVVFLLLLGLVLAAADTLDICQQRRRRRRHADRAVPLPHNTAVHRLRNPHRHQQTGRP